MRCASLLKGISPIRGWSRFSAVCSRPAFSAATIRAASVGSPRTAARPSTRSILASLHRAPIRRARARCSSRPGSTRWPPTRNSPDAAYPLPVISTRRSPSWSARTVISFWVRVPVLSVQITVVEPRVSTAGSRRTRTRMPAMRCIPRARVMVVTASSPSGTAAMASEMPTSSMYRNGWPRSQPARTITRPSARTTPTSTRPSWASFRSSGVSRSPASSMRVPIFPTSLRMPVAVTIIRPRPSVTVVPMKSMFRRSATGAFRVRDRVGGLGDRLGLAGQGGLFGLQPRRSR